MSGQLSDFIQTGGEAMETAGAFVARNIQYLVGIPLSLFGTLLTISVFHWLLSPRIVFGDSIRSYIRKHKPPTWGYSIKIKNSGIRALVDVRVRCRLAIYELYQNSSDIWSFFDIETGFKESLLFTSGVRYILIRPYESKALMDNTAVQAKFGKEVIYSGEMRLEDFYLGWNDTYVELYVMGRDRFTGLLKVYKSKKYYIFDIDRGKWDGLRLIRLERLPKPRNSMVTISVESTGE